MGGLTREVGQLCPVLWDWVENSSKLQNKGEGVRVEITLNITINQLSQQIKYYNKSNII